MKKKKFKYLIIFFFLISIIYTHNIHHDFYRILNTKLETRSNEGYGNCDKFGEGFIRKSLANIKNTNYIGIYNSNDVAGIKWKFSNFKNLTYLNELKKTKIEKLDFIILISLKEKLNNVKFYNDKIFLDKIEFKIEHSLENCFFIKKI